MIKGVEGRTIGLVIGQSLEGDLAVCVDNNGFLRLHLGLYEKGSLNCTQFQDIDMLANVIVLN